MTDERDLRAGSGGDPGPGEHLLEELRESSGRIAPVPEELVRAALGSFAWRRIDAELAELVHDSSSQGVRGALVRGEDSPRLVSFEGAGLTIEVEVAPAATGRRLLGQLVPAGPAEVEVRHQGGAVTVEADQQGRFRAEGVPPGAFSLRCRRAGPHPVPPVETSWVLL